MRNKESAANTILVAALVSLVCSVLVATAAVVLKPQQLGNARRNMQKNILDVVGLLEVDRSVEELFRAVEVKLVDLATGQYADHPDPSSYDQTRAASDPELSVPIPRELDIASIGRRAKLATVYLVKKNDDVRFIILPVHGAGLWSTLYGFLALERDGNTIVGLQFYEHEETPGLGGEVDNPRWRRLWTGKQVYDASGTPRIEVVRGRVPQPGSEAAQYQIDGLSGATLTGAGITKLLRYWLGEHGYRAYLSQFWRREG